MIRLSIIVMLMMTHSMSWAFHKDAYQVRVPISELDKAREVKNPMPDSEKVIAQGKAVYLGKGLCVTCHSKDGTGVRIPGHSPRDFTDQKWLDLRTDGELMWVLRYGSPGTGMPVRVGTVINEAEGWAVIRYIRTLIDYQ